MIPLFAYGTLSVEDFQLAIFDRTYPMRPATIDGYTIGLTEHGYRTVIEQAGSSVRGQLVALDDDAYVIADAWEEVPFYERIRANVRNDDGETIDCWLYLRPPEAADATAVAAAAPRDREETLAEIREFRRRTG